MNENARIYRWQDLITAIANAGIIKASTGYHWAIALEKKGKLICPRDPVNNYRKFTQAEIDSIVKAFSPGGEGFWKPHNHQ